MIFFCAQAPLPASPVGMISSPSNPGKPAVPGNLSAGGPSAEQAPVWPCHAQAARVNSWAPQLSSVNGIHIFCHPTGPPWKWPPLSLLFWKSYCMGAKLGLGAFIHNISIDIFIFSYFFLILPFPPSFSTPWRKVTNCGKFKFLYCL